MYKYIAYIKQINIVQGGGGACGQLFIVDGHIL